MSQDVNTDAKPKTEPEKKAVKEKKTPGVEVIKLVNPITVDGQEVTEIRLDFRHLTCSDLMNIEDEMQTDGRFALQNASMSTIYSMYVAARASGLNIDDMRKLGFADTSKIRLAVQNFSGKSEA